MTISYERRKRKRLARLLTPNRHKLRNVEGVGQTAERFVCLRCFHLERYAFFLEEPCPK